MKSKGQLAPDYLVTIVFLGILALVVFMTYEQASLQSLRTVERIYADDLADELTRAINSVVIMGDGAQKSITLARTTEAGKAYNFTVRANAVLVRWGTLDEASRFSTANINSTEIRLEPGEILIRNLNGIIYLEKVE